MIEPGDLELLRRHEPILRFTSGELFLPMPAASYVAACDLLSGPSIREAQVVATGGSLTLDALGAVGDPPTGHIQFLRFVPKPMNAVELARWRSRPERPRFSAPGRLARVGLPARLVDAGLVTSLLLRGRVPGGTAAAAERRYAFIRESDPRVSYHGRVVRTEGWVVLHYLFFYAMNDWRSTFDGANDHEADWEQCFIVLEKLPDGSTRPAWFCAAAHDEKGDDLRRRWDDPRLETKDGHPIVYPGAGSHATYLERGEYIMRLPFPGERNLRGPLDLLRRVWRDTLDQPDPGDLAAGVRRALSVPFVDYARGDGTVVGPGGDIEWTPIPIADDEPWVDGYRGLWGLDTGDRFAGERAPAGPKYTRVGTVRQSWADPLGFAGLAKVPQPWRAPEVLTGRVRELEAERDEVRRDAAAIAAELPGLNEEAAALRGVAGLEHYAETRLVALHAEETKLAGLRAREVELTRAIAAARARLTALRDGALDDPRGHLHHASEPELPVERQRRAFGEAWAALSVGLLIVLLAVVVWLRILPAIVALPVLFGGYLAVEAFFNRAVGTLILRIAMFLAIISAVILVVTFIREIVLVGLLLLGLLLIADNVGELRRRAG
ncbi:MAG TPA: hypothetical protein VFO05_14090 [Candidatus Limnocylindrales bacterium]|nr:hypothetical protein [Candidatus Limnocylindrales bacterium]